VSPSSPLKESEGGGEKLEEGPKGEEVNR